MRGRVSRDLEQRAQVAELEAAVDQHGPLLELAEGDRQVEGDGGLADTALRGEDRHDARGLDGIGRGRTPSSRAMMRFMRSKPENGMVSTPWMPLRGIDLDRVLRHGQDDDRHAELGLVDLLDELGPLDPTLEQRVDEDDVRSKLRIWAMRLARPPS